MYHCYILYSEELDRYYIGSCGEDLAGRLARHLSNHSGYTGKAKDWRVVYSESFASRSAVYVRERAIKGKKSRRYIEYLVEQGS